MKKIILILIFVLFSIIYLLFPTNNSSIDGYGYAFSIKYGKELFTAHHLIYNIFQYKIYHFFDGLGLKFDVLSFTKTVNAFFQLINLFIFYLIVKKLKFSFYEQIQVLIIAGMSYSLLRYGTENETYIIPITFSLLGSYFFLEYFVSRKYQFLFLSGLTASLACLFHQIHFFWWFGLMIGTFIYLKNLKSVLIYFSTAPLVLVAYVLVLVYYENEALSFKNYIQYIFQYYFSDSSKTEIGWKNFFFLFISTIRTFVQIHPVILYLIKRNIIFIVPIIGFIISTFILIKLIFQKKLLNRRMNEFHFFTNTHLLILIFQILFSFLSVGNVEFLVMTPYLFLIVMLTKFSINKKALNLIAMLFMTWNFCYGVLPNNKYKFYNDNVLVDFMEKHKNDIFIFRNQEVQYMYAYKTGDDSFKNIYYYPNLNSFSEIKFDDKTQKIYTDVIDKPEILNRSKIMEKGKLNFDSLDKEIITTYDGLFGQSKIYKVNFLK